jgi:hypothetical protein
MKMVEIMPRVCKALKTKGGYFEESQIYFDLTLFGYYMIPSVIFIVYVFTVILQCIK